MATGLKEYISDLAFERNHGKYDFEGDVLRLSIDELRSKYLPLKNDPRFIRKYLGANRPKLLHTLIQSDYEKSLFLINELDAYSLNDFDENGKTPIQQFNMLTDDDKKNDMLCVVFDVMVYLKSKSKCDEIFDDDVKTLLSAGQERNDPRFSILLSGNIDMEKIQKKNTSEDLDVYFDENDFYYFIGQGLIYESMIWAEKNAKINLNLTLDFNIFKTREKHLTFLHLAALHNDERAAKYLLDKNIRHLAEDKNKEVALVTAAKAGSYAVARLLVEKQHLRAVNIAAIQAALKNEHYSTAIMIAEQTQLINDNIFANSKLHNFYTQNSEDDEEDFNYQDHRVKLVSTDGGETTLANARSPFNAAQKIYMANGPVKGVRRESTTTFNINQPKADGNTKLHLAIQQNSSIEALMELGANPYTVNSAGFNAFDLCILNNNQKMFNELVKLTFNSAERYERPAIYQGVNAEKLLNAIVGYLREDDNYNHQILSFFWKNMISPLHEISDKETQCMLAYWGKNAHLCVAWGGNAADNHETQNTKTPNAVNKLLNEIKQLALLSETSSMFSLNTCRHWLRLGYGKSTMNAQLEEIIANAWELFNKFPGGKLSEKINYALRSDNKFTMDVSVYQDLRQQVDDLQKLGHDRSVSYGAEQYIAQAFAKKKMSAT